MKKPTPGPYSVIQWNDGGHEDWGIEEDCPVLIQSKGGAKVASIIACGVNGWQANARLFAQAWTMMQLLEKVAASLNDLPLPEDHPASELRAEVRQVLLNIAGDEDE